MVKAFVMIDVEPGKEKEIQEAIKRIANVQLCYQVTGENDMIALIDTHIDHDLAVVVSTIRKIDGIRDTQTEFVLDVD